jgi:hypothetical protein
LTIFPDCGDVVKYGAATVATVTPVVAAEEIKKNQQTPVSSNSRRKLRRL